MSINLTNTERPYRLLAFQELLSHVGHEVVIVKYQRDGEDSPVMNVSVECETCNEVLFDIDNPDYLNE